MPATQQIAHVGDDLADAAVDRITDSAAQFGNVLATGVSIPDFTAHAAVKAATMNIAAARKRVSDAEATYASAMVEVSELTAKAVAKRARHDELTRLSIAGETGEGSHAERYALSEDIKTIEGMIVEAKSQADRLAQPLNAARIDIKAAEKQVATVEHRLRAEHLAKHCQALSSALIECLRATQAAGAKAGVTVGSLVSPSVDLRNWISTGAVTRPYGRG